MFVAEKYAIDIKRTAKDGITKFLTFMEKLSRKAPTRKLHALCLSADR